jgi:hypothetical protein
MIAGFLIIGPAKKNNRLSASLKLRANLSENKFMSTK